MNAGEDGISREPYEEVTVDIDPEMQGLVIDSMSHRKGNLMEMKVVFLFDNRHITLLNISLYRI
jgi:predicted membrane GTPase involved in stress response